jgi:hypothetical protein
MANSQSATFPQRPITPKMTLFEARDVWLEGKSSKGRSPKTLECCNGQTRAVKRFFGDIPLGDFTAGSFNAYQSIRRSGTGAFVDAEGKPHPVGVSAVNHELNALQQILRRAGLWTAIGDFYSPLKEEPWKGPKTFTTTEQTCVFEASGADPNLEPFDMVTRITRNTTASGCELRGLRHRNLELTLTPPRIHIPPDATKNGIRPRPMQCDFSTQKSRSGTGGRRKATSSSFALTVDGHAGV